MNKYDRGYYKKHKRIRDKGYNDYGIAKGTDRRILEYARNSDLSEKIEILEICHRVNSDIAGLLFDSITNRLSYEKLDRKYNVPYMKNDFYAYRRKAMAEIYCSMMKKITHGKGKLQNGAKKES